ncbi:protein shisa-5-like [Astatotilapia calliptera]|uniref:protein shisa-5-like n=1 Tax=Astatotilapia calliptera TaxID=8154 RepID=UPI000E40B179|nr:protein shisa-5-like [Astatotilapia calliptera]XP_026023527.1 protein shisa-5-like [Astatotilapia calliptera]XP_026023528.1 protein shisa-5-like [Astatotilapia calliptera]
MNDFNLLCVILGIVFWCCVFTCSCLCRSAANPNSEVAAATHTLVTATPQQYPQQYPQYPVPPQSYQRVPYQPVPGHPGYPAMPGNQAVLMTIPLSYEQPFTPPPSYQDAIGPTYPLQPINQSSSQPECPSKPPAQPQSNALTDSSDFLASSANNQEFVLPYRLDT